MLEVKYEPYKIGSFCKHDTSKSRNNFVDLVCNKSESVIHRVSQIGRFCNKCAAQITKSFVNVDECLCCSEKLEEYLSNTSLCQHANKVHDQITIKCLDHKGEFHEVPLPSKVCDQCFDKIRAAFMFSQSCVVCAEKQSHLFNNLENTLVLPAHFYYEHIVQICFQQNLPDEQIKKEIQSYCLAAPRVQFKSKLRSQIQEVTENIESYHQSKRYQLYPKCTKHRNYPLSLCNNCLVAILNLDRCPFGCPYEKKEKKKAAENVKIEEVGFVSLYPKFFKESPYLQLFTLRQIDEPNRLVRWESSLKKIRLSESCNAKINNKFSLYAGTVELTNDKLIYTGGVQGLKMSCLETTNTCFVIEFSKNRKEFIVKDIAPMLEPRSSHTLVKMENYVFAIGGFSKEKGEYLNSCERYSIEKNQWERVLPMKVQRSKPTCIKKGSYIYTFGGLTNSPEIGSHYGERYSLKEEKWESLIYDGYDYPYLVGAVPLNTTLRTENTLLVGGSNYQYLTNYLQQIEIKDDHFKMNPQNLTHQLTFKRDSPCVSVMNTTVKNEKILVVFGGLEEHQPFLNFDAIRVRLVEDKGKVELNPIFVYDDIQVGSYRRLLRDNAKMIYEEMLNKLMEQQLITKEKLEKQKDEMYKSQFNVQMIEKMWYGIGKNIVPISL